MSEYSIPISDWHEYDSNGDRKWNLVSRDLLIEKKGEWADDNRDGISEDESVPIMNYAYPLYQRPSDEQVLAVAEETCCAVVENTESGDFYLALCGGGMDLSQDIALAYVLCGERIPAALALEVSKQYGLSKSGANWFKIADAILESLKVERDWCIRGIEEWEKAIVEGKKKERSDKRHYAKIAKELTAKKSKKAKREVDTSNFGEFNPGGVQA